ncbi:hypothetical protein BJV78DRAFT_1181125 [Lactifluus subvellereus]|nr:hypothetical protein BJV78DRAFT_1181125 [Lactifluus subvellereus]
MNILRSHEEQMAIVSRATLFSEGACFTADGDKLAELDELLKASFGGFEVSQTRKREKCTGSVEGQSVLFERPEPAPFRLVSTAHPPKVISLEPRPLPERTIREPPCEDTDREAKLRKQQALSAAVDVPSLFKSAQAYTCLPAKAGKVIRARADVPLSCLAVFLAEMPYHSDSRPSRVAPGRGARPSPHEAVLKGDKLTVISLKLQQGSEQLTARSKRKCRRRKIERPTV